jgi:hypothetical protein
MENDTYGNVWEQRYDQLVSTVFFAAYGVVERWADVPGLDAHGEEWLDNCFADDLHAWVTSRVKPLSEELRKDGWEVVADRDREYTMARTEEALTSQYLDLLVEAREEFFRFRELPVSDDPATWAAFNGVCARWTRVIAFLAVELGIESRILGILGRDWQIDAA